MIKAYSINLNAHHIMTFTLCIVLINHHACIDDEAQEEVVEEPQEVKVIDEPPEVAQSSPLLLAFLSDTTKICVS